MVKDPVCGMNVDEGKATAKSTHEGRTYCFCSPGCRDKFERNPQQYAKGTP